MSLPLSSGLNPTLLFGRYKSGGHFAPHTDGNTIIDFNHRSLRSVIIYLSDCKVRSSSDNIYMHCASSVYPRASGQAVLASRLEANLATC